MHPNDQTTMSTDFSTVMPLAERPPVKALTEADAVDIWIKRWLRIRVTDIRKHYGCDSRRLYEVWEEKKFPRARVKAEVLFRERHPGIVDRIDYGAHVRISKVDDPNQLGLFGE
jgi:hypothetical protein